MLVALIIIAIVILYGPHLWARYVIQRYNRDEYFSGNGFDLARLLLQRENLDAVGVETTPLGDHYDPEKKTVGLTTATCGRKTLTAVVVAAHEVGHALQDHEKYPPLAVRTRLIRTASRLERIGAGIMMVVPVLAVVTRLPAASALMFLGGLTTLGMPIVVHMLTLPTEFNASFKRALPLLVEGAYIPPEDIPAARRILLACALTYVANAMVGLLNVWRWIRVLRR
ncbi:MAG: zinc metallopeptidase [Desulfobacterales bacterium]|nr:zinc metallopeptidase [Desulfobacterales bacterium]MDJ0854458.1 zinc metallopeptidase [Desulfobacterales bacterium]MDJ0885925.1 zinc metallopeptidase [Desulfobacterales bacterium]MDJ0988712.1 zinc metallopeptidase [Desulfobacterales bacterium]